jgi:hypothetical protein
VLAHRSPKRVFQKLLQESFLTKKSFPVTVAGKKFTKYSYTFQVIFNHIRYDKPKFPGKGTTVLFHREKEDLL